MRKTLTFVQSYQVIELYRVHAQRSSNY